MALITPGYWQSTYWLSSYWQQDYWLEYAYILYSEYEYFKWGYINNPYWVEKPEFDNVHFPCGYFFKRKKTL